MHHNTDCNENHSLQIQEISLHPPEKQPLFSDCHSLEQFTVQIQMDFLESDHRLLPSERLVSKHL